jgi:hypothetical protein
VAACPPARQTPWSSEKEKWSRGYYSRPVA